ncbi:Retrovirus-related Pol polyprotein from transposon TNT 1-94 [Rhizoctonia solani]|uniref:Retrovirus-related Pol polyprotein from transposon TNT 1-94 n=1 Tax=Rhizoctonia solani TaxID=456999 RepID=A0A0K6GIG8_9AGAM|nr:Retrovirus-related Pol polyprotein from transposon TNT 1-94 [Rhizoctonia solani]
MDDIITTTRQTVGATVIINGSSHTVTQEEVNLWDKHNRKALATIRRNLTESVLTHVLSSSTAKEAWDRLVGLYEISDIVELVSIRRQYFSHRMAEDAKIEDHLKQMQEWFDCMQAIGPTYATSFDKAVTLPSSLPPSWDIFIQTLQSDLNDLNAPSADRAAIASRIERKIVAEGQHCAQANVSNAMYAGHKEKGKGKGKSNNSSQGNKNLSSSQEKKRSGNCNYCNKAGHWEKECRKKKKDLKEKKDKDGGEKKEETAKVATTSEGKGGPPTYSFMAVQDYVGTDWIADSGAESHFVVNANSFSSYYKTPGQIVRGVGGSLPIIGRGDVKATFRKGGPVILLKDCAHVPAMKTNLFSITCFTKAGGSATFKNDTARFTTPDGKFLGKAKRQKDGGLYILPISLIEQDSSTEAVQKAYAAFQPVLEEMQKEVGKGEMPTIDESPKDYFCEACIQAKQHKAPFSKESETKYMQVGELVVSDIWGPSQVQSLQGNAYFCVFIDAFSRFSAVYFMKSNKETREHYKSFEALIRTQTGNSIKRFRSDEGKEYVNQEFKSYVQSQGTVQELTAPHSSSSNGMAERLMRTLLDHGRAALQQYELPRYLWQQAVGHINYIKNRIPTQAHGKTPYELFYGTKPKIAKLEEFGAYMWVLDQPGKAKKLDAKSHKYHFTGYGDNSRAFSYWKPETHQILLTRNVIFVPQEPVEQDIDYENLQEAELPVVGGVNTPDQSQQTKNPTTPTKSSKPKPGVFTPPPKTKPATGPDSKVQPSTPPKKEPKAETPVPSAPEKGKGTPRFTTQLPGVKYTSQNPRRTSRPIKQTDYRQLHLYGHTTSNNASEVVSPPSTSTRAPGGWDWEREPSQTFSEFIPGEDDSQDGSSSEEIADEEPESEDEVEEGLLGLEEEWHEYAYVAISHPHDDNHPTYEEMLTRWDADMWSKAREEEILIFLKYDTFEKVDLPKGFKVLDCHWVNVVKRFGQRYGIDYASILDWDIISLDVKSAFLNGRLEEEIYMRQILGYDDGSGQVLRIKGNLYGLKQAPRVWNKIFSEKALGIGFNRTTADPSLYYRNNNGKIAILAVYVDDIAVFTTRGYSQLVKEELMSLFEMRDLGELKEFLVERAGLSDANPTKLPIPAGTSLQRYDGKPIDYPYSTRIGELLYAALGSRPDIAFAVQHLSQFSSNPRPQHITMVKQIYKYLRGTLDLGITYNGNKDQLMPIGYTDADWGQNILDRRSISGQIYILAGGAVSWSSKKQTTVALSTLEAEYLALSLAVRQAIWLRYLFADLELTLSSPITIYIDNNGTIRVASDPQHHSRTKHIDVRHQFIRHHVACESVQLAYTSSSANLADHLTKAIPSIWLQRSIDGWNGT